MQFTEQMKADPFQWKKSPRRPHGEWRDRLWCNLLSLSYIYPDAFLWREPHTQAGKLYKICSSSFPLSSFTLALFGYDLLKATQPGSALSISFLSFCLAQHTDVRRQQYLSLTRGYAGAKHTHAGGNGKKAIEWRGRENTWKLDWPFIADTGSWNATGIEVNVQVLYTLLCEDTTDSTSRWAWSKASSTDHSQTQLWHQDGICNLFQVRHDRSACPLHSQSALPKMRLEILWQAPHYQNYQRSNC